MQLHRFQHTDLLASATARPKQDRGWQAPRPAFCTGGTLRLTKMEAETDLLVQDDFLLQTGGPGPLPQVSQSGFHPPTADGGNADGVERGAPRSPGGNLPLRPEDPDHGSEAESDFWFPIFTP